MNGCRLRGLRVENERVKGLRGKGFERLLPLVTASLDLCKDPDGVSIGELPHQIEPPGSILLIVLKWLGSEGKVRTRLRGIQRVYFSRSGRSAATKPKMFANIIKKLD